jgi:hypothetical protein
LKAFLCLETNTWVFVTNICHFFLLKKTVDIDLILVYNMHIRYWCVKTLILNDLKGKRLMRYRIIFSYIKNLVLILRSFFSLLKSFCNYYFHTYNRSHVSYPKGVGFASLILSLFFSKDLVCRCFNPVLNVI